MVKTKPKDIGTKFETACVNIFKDEGFSTRRLALSGNADQGDLELILDEKKIFVIECKCHRAWSRGDLEKWREEAYIESLNYGESYDVITFPVLIVSQFNKANIDSYVHLYNETAWIQVYLDEFIELLKVWKGEKDEH